MKSVEVWMGALAATCALALLTAFRTPLSTRWTSTIDALNDETIEVVVDTIHDDVDYAVGSAYPLPDPAEASEAVAVAIWGDWGEAVVKYSGFPTSNAKGVCPLFPKCSFHIHPSVDKVPPRTSSVIVTKYGGGEFIEPRKLLSLKKQIKVLYWREIKWLYPPPAYQKLHDLQMSVHFDASINNPSFTRLPGYMLNGPMLSTDYTKRTELGMSLISDCKANSQRDLYLKRLNKRLNKKHSLSLHRYGKCGDRSLSHENPTTVLQTTLANYKFFMSFENEIAKGYVSEKYFKILSSGCVPVYYGAPDVPQLTKSKSFINAANYKTPELLADYLAHLTRNLTAYAEYTRWRYERDPFNDWFKRYLAHNMYSVEELKAAKGALRREGGSAKSDFLVVRRAAACRLCNLPFLEALKSRNADSKKGYEYHAPPWNPGRINQYLFDGTAKSLH